MSKAMTGEMAATYDPKAVEEGWYDQWEKAGHFAPKSDKEETDAKPFVLVLPPPNVTGHLHLGHALTGAVQDSIVRFHRMKGDNTLYLPGTDHAGIATQVVVEKKLQKEEGLSRYDLGREKFLEKVWDYKENNSDAIHRQLRQAGSSLDWSREKFTMDPSCGVAVTEAFVRLHEQGLIYRAKRLVNWCCTLQSAISDLEVDFADVEKKAKIACPGYGVVDMGVLTHVAYKVVGTEEELVFATTRPETMLGDAALAIHPDDERYKKFHGKKAYCPWRECEIPIVLDGELVTMGFGTGVVKVTPAHDPNDFECGKRHNLEAISVLDKAGKIALAGKYHGMHRFDCRKAIVKDLEEMGILRGVEPHEHRVPKCSRTNDIVEPMLMEQWWVNCDDMAKQSTDAVREKRLKLTPDHHEATWFHFLDNVKPWCISRQLWWGHRIPAYKVQFKGIAIRTDDDWVAARNEEEAMTKAMAKFNVAEADKEHVTIHQDADVLDTWFSSALWPFSTMGWPNETPDMKKFFPNALLETGHDILFFWVARMVMMSLHFTGELPFSEVFLHAMVRDKDGRKMSKSLGNVIDPMDVIFGIELEALHEKVRTGNLHPGEVEKAIKFQKKAFPSGIPQCGSDALRFGLLAYTQSGRSVNLDVERVVGYRQFCNKLWNATRYILYHAIDKDFVPTLKVADLKGKLPLDCQWILSRLENAITEVTAGLSELTYDFALATNASYRFWLYELCDVFLEVTKPVMQTEGERKTITQTVLLHVVEVGLRMLHPMMPYVTEELWHRLPHYSTFSTESIMVAPWPVAEGFFSEPVETEMKLVMDVVHALRSTKANYQLTNKTKPECWIVVPEGDKLALLKAQTLIMETLGVVGTVTVIAKSAEEEIPVGCGFHSVTHEVAAHMMLKGHIDVSSEVTKIQKKISLLEKSLEGLKKKMTIPNYATKVPAAVQQQNTEKETALTMEIKQVGDAKAKMEALQ